MFKHPTWTPPFTAWAAAVVVYGDLRQFLEVQAPAVDFGCLEIAELRIIKVQPGKPKSD